MVQKPQTFHEEAPQSTLEDPPEAELEVRVADALARTGALDASMISVVALGSTVILTGVVGLDSEMHRASEVAQQVTGVTDVDNLVTARSPDPR